MRTKRPFHVTKETTPTSFHWKATWKRSPRNFLIYMILKSHGGVDRDLPDGDWIVTLSWRGWRHSLYAPFSIIPGLLFREA